MTYTFTRHPDDAQVRAMVELERVSYPWDSHQWGEDEFRACIDGRNTFAFLVEDGRMLALGVLADPVDGVGYIDNLDVHPDVQRRGLGSKMLHALEDLSRQQGARVMELDVQLHNQKAEAFYHRHGYAVKHGFDPLPEDPMSKRMAKSLV